jgi:8-hydroxy-5-deazaflavin:NADPH oxidoreductase
MRIAVIGTGNIGTTLGAAWARAGHDVVMGSRNPDASAQPPETEIRAALEGADAVLLAIPARAVDDFLAAHGAALGDKLVIDATNNVGATSAHAAEAIHRAAPAARYARAFNTLGWENFAEPTFDGVAADLFFSAAQTDRDAVAALISDVGLRPAYLGPDKHDLVDSLLPLWFTLAQLRGTRHLALRILE